MKVLLNRSLGLNWKKKRYKTLKKMKYKILKK